MDLSPAGADSAQEFLDSFPEELGCIGESTPEGAWTRCWEPATSFYGCEPGGHLTDDPMSMTCTEPLVNYFWYADPSALDDLIVEYQDDPRCFVRSERSVVIIHGIENQPHPSDDSKILQNVSESFAGATEFVGTSCQ